MYIIIFFYFYLQGMASRLEVSGSMTIKNFISGSSQVKIALNEDLSILEGKSKGTSCIFVYPEYLIHTLSELSS